MKELVIVPYEPITQIKLILIVAVPANVVLPYKIVLIGNNKKMGYRNIDVVLFLDLRNVGKQIE